MKCTASSRTRESFLTMAILSITLNHMFTCLSHDIFSTLRVMLTGSMVR
jgi:hypothetical protein